MGSDPAAAKGEDRGLSAAWVDFGAGAGGGTTAIVLLGVPVARWVWRRFVRAFDQAVVDSLRRIERTATATLRQVTPNGGTTARMADRVVRAEQNAHAVARAVGVPEDEILAQTEDDDEAEYAEAED